MNRRDFLALTAAATLAAPLRALAQAAQMKRLAFINSFAQDDPAMAPFLLAARQGLASQGWVEGRNLDINYWFAVNQPGVAVTAAKAAIELLPDVIIAVGPTATSEVGKQTQTIPVAFFAGGVTALGRPTGNVTGFTQADPSAAAKLPDLLREVSPATKRVATMVDSSVAPDFPAISVFKNAAAGLGLEPSVLVADRVQEIGDAIDRFAQGGDAGFVGVNAGSFVPNNHDTVNAAVMRNKMPTVYGNLVYEDQGVVNYYIDNFDAIRRVSEYAGLILNGTKVSDLPIQAPTKYLLTVNLATAKLLNLAVPESVTLRADRVIS